jgi:putative Mn2+ efflux pump MntP
VTGVTVVLTAVGLAMDAFAVSITSGITLKRPTIANGVQIALFFGGFQALMPLLGWAGGRAMADIVTGFDHWVAFGLLTLIGGKMICEATRDEAGEGITNPLHPGVLLMLAVATSIDAFAVGVTFAFLNIAILGAVATIGAITFAISFVGVYAGNGIGRLCGNKMEIVGGLVLIAIGVKILIEGLGGG